MWTAKIQIAFYLDPVVFQNHFCIQLLSECQQEKITMLLFIRKIEQFQSQNLRKKYYKGKNKILKFCERYD